MGSRHREDASGDHENAGDPSDQQILARGPGQHLADQYDDQAHGHAGDPAGNESGPLTVGKLAQATVDFLVGVHVLKPSRLWPLLLAVFVISATPVTVEAASKWCVAAAAQAPATNTTQDFTVSGCGTPTWAVVEVTTATTAGTAAVDATYNVGFTDFTTNVQVANSYQDNVATTSADNVSVSTRLLTYSTPGQQTTVRTITAASAITDGVRLTFAGTNTAIRPLVRVYFGNGTSAAKVGSVSVPTGIGSTVTATGLAAAPTVVFFAWLANAGGVDAGYDNSIFRASFGVAVNDGSLTQRDWQFSATDNVTTPFSDAATRTNRVGGELATGGRSGELTAFTSDGFTITKRDDTTARTLFYLALTIPDTVKLGSVDSPTSTGAAWTVTGPGFTPQFVMLGMTPATAYDTQIQQGAAANFVSDCTTSNTLGFSVKKQSGVSNSDAQSLVANKILFADHDFTTLHDISGFTCNGSGWTTSNPATANSTARKWFYFAVQGAASAPTYTADPAIGTRTTSSIPITQTSACTDCTAYFIAETDGLGLPTCTQIKAGNGADGNAAYKAVSGALTATVQLTLTLGTYTDGTLRDGYGCLNSTAGGDSAVKAIADMYKLPAFSTPLSVASQTTSVYTSNSKVLDGPGTVTWNAVPAGASAPSVSQCNAGTGGGIVATNTDDATGTMTLTISGTPGSTINPKYDLYYCGTYGGQVEAAVHALTDEYLDCPSCEWQALGSVGALSYAASYNATTRKAIAFDGQSANFTVGKLIADRTSGAYGRIENQTDAGTTGTVYVWVIRGTFADNDVIEDSAGGAALVNGTPSTLPDIASSDVLGIPTNVIKDDTTTGEALSHDSTGDVWYDPSPPGDFSRRRALDWLIYDASAQGYMKIDIDAWWFDASPGCTPPKLDWVIEVGVMIPDPIDLNTDQGNCSDADGDALDTIKISGTDPSQVSLVAGVYGNGQTPDTEHEAGYPLDFLAMDQAGAYADKEVTAWPLTSVTVVTDCVGDVLTVQQCEIALRVELHNAVSFTESLGACVSAPNVGTVTSQSPAPMDELAPFDVVALGYGHKTCILRRSREH